MKTLLHICCAPCANQPIEVLRGDKIEVTGFWYNPNIHPFTEYRARRNCVREYAGVIELPLIERDDYGLRPFVRSVAEDIAGRCVKCYEMRLFETAKTAKENGLDPYRYLLWALRNAPALSRTDETWAEKLVPALAPQECRVPHK